MISFAQERKQLAAAFRWTARLNMHEAIANHFSLSVGAGTQNLFLLNPPGRHFSHICASDLLLLDSNDDSCLTWPNPPERTAWAIHGALHRNVGHAQCILHVHSKYATVLASLDDPTLPPIDQNSMRFFEQVAVDRNFAGMGLSEEAERLSTCLGNKSVLLMGNHGVLIVGSNVAQAFDALFYFEKSCETYITALMTGKKLSIVSDYIARKTANQWLEQPEASEAHFADIIKILDEEGSNYAL